jgi:hypothetical protein
MLYLALVVFVVSIGILTAGVTRQRGVSQGSLAATGLWVGGLIALARLGLFWGGLALYTGHADWRQGAGYALLILSSVVELVLAASWSGRHPGPPLLVAGLIVLTSAGLGFAWAWIRSRPPFRGAA